MANTLKALAVLSLLVTALLCTHVSAGVIYRWQDLLPNEVLGTSTGAIEIADSYWQPGATVQFKSPGTISSVVLPSGLEDFYFGPDQAPAMAVGKGGWGACDGSQYNDCFDLTLTFGSTLTGSIAARDLESGVRMNSASVGSIWTINFFGSDNPFGPNCYPNDIGVRVCNGGTGLWLLDLSTVPGIPEPGTLALVGVGLFGLVTTRRRRLASAPQ